MGSCDEACQAVSWLLQQGADPYVRCRWTNMAAIHYAAYFDVASVAALLLAATKGIGTLCCVLLQIDIIHINNKLLNFMYVNPVSFSYIFAYQHFNLTVVLL